MLATLCHLSWRTRVHDALHVHNKPIGADLMAFSLQRCIQAHEMRQACEIFHVLRLVDKKSMECITYAWSFIWISLSQCACCSDRYAWAAVPRASQAFLIVY